MGSRLGRWLVGSLTGASMLGAIAWVAEQLRPVRTDPSSWAVREELHTALSPAPLRSLARAPTKTSAERHKSPRPAERQEMAVVQPPSAGEPTPAVSAPGVGALVEVSAPELEEPLAVSAEPEPPRESPPERRRALPTPDCGADLRLVGSAVNEARPGLSRAVVRNAAGAFLLGVGGRIDTFTVVSIEPTRAALRDPSGALCSLSGAAAAPPVRSIEAAQPAPAASAEAHPEPKARPVFSKDDLAKGVRALGGGEYAVSRQLLLKAMTNPGGAAGGAWFRPFKRDGQSVGMEVRAVRDGTALKAMGIETGDVARTVNGIALDNPQGLLAALRAVREADTITIGILRNGQARDMRYLTE